LEIKRLESATIGANEKVQSFLESHGSTLLKSGSTLAELVRRPELSYEMLAPLDPDRPSLPYDVTEQVDINIKYDGYIRRQNSQVQQFKKLEKRKLDPDFDYTQIKGLRREAIQKLNQYKPISIGQASRISGVSPADISVLLVYLEQMNRQLNR
jgi:tRNA uridine 5-carboxymethylaminomethyl modification enzyme